MALATYMIAVFASPRLIWYGWYDATGSAPES